MEERATLTQKMADDARRSGRDAAAVSYERRVSESRAYAGVLRKAAEAV
jgi:two-component system chemotaxis response regulator CheB